MAKRVLSVGLKIGRLVLLENLKGKWRCLCDCGNEALPWSSALTSALAGGKGARSCGCLMRELAVKKGQSRRVHGHAGSGSARSPSPEYRALMHLIHRCESPTDAAYKNYGARGISVCDEWKGLGGFERFLTHIGLKPSPDLTIERIDNNGNYEPGNVKWGTRVEQGQNRRGVINIIYEGENKCLAEWARIKNLNAKMLYWRYNHGLRDERLFEPANDPLMNLNTKRRAS